MAQRLLPKDLAPDLFILCSRKNVSVANAINSQRWMSGLKRITSPLQLRQFTALWLQLQQIQLQPEIDDSICWNLTSSKVYSASSAYRSQFLGSYSTSRFDKLWRCKVEGKCRLFMWLWLHGRILTNENLDIKGIPHSKFCHLCNQEDETPFHLILRCSFSRSI